jgi:5-methylcytosine-specific restriction protein A
MRDQLPGRKFLHSATWRKIRLEKLKKDPLCQRCLAIGVASAANIVHHIDEDELNNDPSNHQSVCERCHSELHKDIAFGNDKRQNNP